METLISNVCAGLERVKRLLVSIRLPNRNVGKRGVIYLGDTVVALGPQSGPQRRYCVRIVGCGK